jgi:hypothetical protein
MGGVGDRGSFHQCSGYVLIKLIWVVAVDGVMGVEKMAKERNGVGEGTDPFAAVEALD